MKIIYFLLLLGACGFTCNEIYARHFYKQDVLEADATLLFELDSLQSKSDVLYFAESSNATLSLTDTCSKSISEMMGELIPTKINAIQHSALHAGCFLQLIKRIPANTKVKTVIVTMNLRSFGADWINSHAESSLMKANIMYGNDAPLLKRIKIAFNAFDNRPNDVRDKIKEYHWRFDKLNVSDTFQHKNVRQWDNYTAVEGAFLSANGERDMPKTRLACAYIKEYAFSIDMEKNPRIKDFDEIVRIAKEKKLNLVFNLLSENVSYADSLVGRQLTILMRQNRDLLMKRYNKGAVIVVDNLELVHPKDFADQDWTTEHYNERGRRAIAKSVAEAAKIYLKEE